MKKIRRIHTILALLSLALLAACSLQRPHLSTSSLYDLGPARAATGRMPPAINVSIAEINAAAWLDNSAIFYRLLYANDLQPRAYSQNRWIMPPMHLLEQRLKARIAQAGGIASSASEGAVNLPMVRIEADDFSQVFTAPDKSRAEIALRVSLLNGRTLIAQKSFHAEAPAPSNDAGGGVRALATASDAIIDDIINWLATQTVKR